MVRFSDMLGGNDDAQRARAASAPSPVPTDDIPEADPEEDDDDPGGQDPEAVLDRLTQYATSARAADSELEPPAPRAPSEPDAELAGDLSPVGDDLLPHGKAETRKRRRK
jgi:hypothetical protein